MTRLVQHRFLGGLSTAAFLERYWQKAPLFVSGALPDLNPPLTPEALRTLACREDVQSRLVVGDAQRAPRVSYGPMTPRQLRALPKTQWTLLVQDVDQFVPAARALFETFRFVPDWRMDDLMISYAAPGGSVGPHYDQYDVFLIQALGTRTWKIAKNFDPQLRPDCDLRVLSNFQAEQEYQLAPGDLLYVPPGVAHFGIGEDPSMTLSVGFRAPDETELLCGFAQELLETLQQESGERPRFGDPDRTVAQDPALLDAGDRAGLRSLLRRGLELDDRALDAFLGRFLTRPKDHLVFAGDETDDAIETEDSGTSVRRRAGSRWAYYRSDDGLHLFVDGAAYAVAPDQSALCERLARGEILKIKDLQVCFDSETLSALWSAGAFERQT
jgi:50S ribosomal protein L16 3-hydroxylase